MAVAIGESQMSKWVDFLRAKQEWDILFIPKSVLVFQRIGETWIGIMTYPAPRAISTTKAEMSIHIISPVNASQVSTEFRRSRIFSSCDH
jgi:hypothetical protein